MTNNTDNENTVVFNTGNDTPPPPDGGTQLFTPPNAQQQAQFQRPGQQQYQQQPQYQQNSSTQFFAPPSAQQQAQFQRPSQSQTPQPQYQQPQFQQPQYQQQTQYQPQQPQYQQPQYQVPPPPPQQNITAYDPFSKPPKKSYKGLIAAVIALIAVLVIGATAAVVILKKRNEENDSKRKSSSSEYSSEDEDEQEYRQAAASLWKASETVLSDWTANSVGVKNALITSDKNSDVYDGDASAEEFREGVEKLYPEISGYDYIIVIQNGECTGTAVSDSFTSRKVGTRSEGADMEGKTLRDILSSLAESMPDIGNDEKLRKVVPNVVGMTQQSAIDKITSEGFYAAVDGVYDDDIPEGIVIKQSVKSSEEADVGTEITITVSLGKEPSATEVEVPNVKNIHYELAQEQLEAAGLEVKIVYTESSEVAKDIVISQSAAANTMVEKGTEVTLQVSSGSSEEPSTEHTTSQGVVVTEETELNVRKSPSTSSEILGTLPQGTTVTINGQSEIEGRTWYEIEYDGGIGYVSADYIEII